MTLLILFILTLSSLVSAEMFSMVEDLKQEGRITNGETAKPGQFPWQAGLRLRLLGGIGWCGASLITERFLLTAAHCTIGVIKMEVILGSINRTDPEVTTKAIKIIVHPRWRPSNLENDIALVKISRVALSPNIGTIELPKGDDAHRNLTGEIAITCGWGRISDSSTGVTDLLQCIQMVVISKFVCSKTYDEAITDNIICTDTAGGVSTCNGDSGGALVLPLGRIQIGITSFGSSAGCERGKPVAFTRVSKYIGWINSIIKTIL